ncbi:MAG: FecCD family ABC transporter permease, partial [Actinomycetota bacterium]
PASLGPGLVLAALAVLAGAVLAGVLVGPVRLSPADVLAEIADRLPFLSPGGGLSERDAVILWQLRMPRVILGGLVGGTLAVSGAAYQGVFRNPLADPYLLGAAAGAGLGATLAIAYGLDVTGSAGGLLPLAAFAGALLGVGAAYALGRSAGRRSPSTLVLAGVAVASFLTALQTYVQQREAETLREVYAWILGRLATAGWAEVVLILPYVAVSAVVIVACRRLLDVMSVGDEEAAGLGVTPSRIRAVIVAAASLGTAAAVAVSGLIGFVGIIVPHAVRLIAGPSYRLIVPLSLVFGGAFLVLADVAARTVMAPAELPIGVITAFFGAPFFALVLRGARRAV